MIKSFRCKRTEALFIDGACDKAWRRFDRIARRKLLVLDAATKLGDLKASRQSPGGSRKRPCRPARDTDKRQIPDLLRVEQR